MSGESINSPRRITAKERAADALRLRKMNASYESIARQLGYKSASGAKMAIDRALQATLQEPAEDLRKMELERLDEAAHRIWPKVIQGDFQAIDRLLKIMDHRAKLMGLYAPVELKNLDEGNFVFRVPIQAGTPEQWFEMVQARQLQLAQEEADKTAQTPAPKAGP